MARAGLDVHQAQSVAAVLDPISGELRVERLRGAPAAVPGSAALRNVSLERGVL
jgi:hypothetical protein